MKTFSLSPSKPALHSYSAKSQTTPKAHSTRSPSHLPVSAAPDYHRSSHWSFATASQTHTRVHANHSWTWTPAQDVAVHPTAADRTDPEEVLPAMKIDEGPLVCRVWWRSEWHCGNHLRWTCLPHEWRAAIQHLVGEARRCRWWLGLRICFWDWQTGERQRWLGGCCLILRRSGYHQLCWMKIRFRRDIEV